MQWTDLALWRWLSGQRDDRDEDHKEPDPAEGDEYDHLFVDLGGEG